MGGNGDSDEESSEELSTANTGSSSEVLSSFTDLAIHRLKIPPIQMPGPLKQGHRKTISKEFSYYENTSPLTSRLNFLLVFGYMRDEVMTLKLAKKLLNQPCWLVLDFY